MPDEQPPFEGIADADRHLGRPVPLPAVALPLARWVDVAPAGPDGVEVVWNLDDTRPGTPARLVLHVAGAPPPAQALADEAPAQAVDVGGAPGVLRSAPLAQAQPSLRPVHELTWSAGGLHLRLTAQGPWQLHDLLRIATSICG
ncbi:MAG TPA: hypothetical protein VD931_02325 [Baekduia sp.]|nr:hypothetical protein [Baekduia sp.]